MADFSTSSQASANHSSLSNSFMSTSSFTNLLNSHDYSFAASPTTAVTHNSGDRIAERRGSSLPKFMSIPPPSVPLSPAPVSPSSYFAVTPGLSPSGLLDSPAFLSGSNILASPTTGTFPFQAFNWNNFSSNQQVVKNEENIYSDFSFQPQISGSQTTIVPSGQIQEVWKYQEPIGQNGFSAEKPNSQISNGCQEAKNSYKESSQKVSERKSSEDGYNWKKYGQKQVKGSENPRSYYKCTYPNCPTKKKVETSLVDGHITEIVYRGSHNHPKPQSTRKSSSSNSSIKCYNTQINDTTAMDQPYGFVGNGQMDSAATTENSSITMGDDDFEQTSQITKSSGEEVDDDEPHAKRWKKENEGEEISAPGSRTVREPRVVLQTTSEIDILDDGYRWRKYGQKVVNGNPNPRSYYKCTSTGCGVRKQVERAMHDVRSVITTYQGKHNHDVPAARGSGNSHSVTRPLPSIPSNNALAFDSY